MSRKPFFPNWKHKKTIFLNENLFLKKTENWGEKFSKILENIFDGLR